MKGINDANGVGSECDFGGDGGCFDLLLVLIIHSALQDWE